MDIRERVLGNDEKHGGGRRAPSLNVALSIMDETVASTAREKKSDTERCQTK